jgi:hypothetical protein
MKRAGIGAMGLGVLASAGTLMTPTPAAAQTAPTDVDVLNFALNLEYLEAEYYLRALTGAGVQPQDRVGGNGQPAGVVTAPANTLVPFVTPAIRQYAQTIAADEQAHVQFLRAALGTAAAPSPAINVGDAFTTLAIAAGIITTGQTFNPYQDENAFLLGAFIFEDVGVTAYGGAAALITNKTYLSAAASILAVEAYHSATVRTLLALRGGGNATGAVANLRSTLSAGAPGIDDQGTLQPNGNVNVFPGDANALTYRRTTRQVLNIVYGAANATQGLFFPNGLSGTITA